MCIQVYNERSKQTFYLCTTESRKPPIYILYKRRKCKKFDVFLEYTWFYYFTIELNEYDIAYFRQRILHH